MLIRQVTILNLLSSFNEQTVDVWVENGKIKDIGFHLDKKGDTPELKGNNLYLSAGWVDSFADYREPGFEQKETITTGLAAAAAGGFTDVLLSPNTLPVADSKSAIQYALQRAAGNIVNLHPLGAVSKNIEGKNLAEMLDMRAFGAIAFTDGWQPVQSAGLLLKALEYIKAFKGLILQIPVDHALAAGGLMHEGERSTMLGMPGIPALAETLIIQRDLELLRYTGSRLHITGISAAESVKLIREAKKEGLEITCSVTPYHLALNDSALSTYSSLYKVTPPLRTEADRLALVAGLKDGTIDCITSHHRPQDWDAKNKEFEYAGEGMNIQEMVFPIVWNAVGEEVGITRMVEALSTSPRALFGLATAPIEKGNTASFTLFSTNDEQVYEKANLKSMGMNNPFTGEMLKGKVIGVFNNGIFAANN